MGHYKIGNLQQFFEWRYTSIGYQRETSLWPTSYCRFLL